MRQIGLLTASYWVIGFFFGTQATGIRGGAGRDDREVRIFMNNPLRYGGRAFYQAGCENNDRTTILQVVSNPGWQLPYLCCAMIALGLAVQFGWQLFRFLRGSRANPGAPAP